MSRSSNNNSNSNSNNNYTSIDVMAAFKKKVRVMLSHVSPVRQALA